MSEFDDRQLRRRLGDLAGTDPDMAAAHRRISHRTTQVRRRRVAMVSGSACVALLLFGVVYAAGGRGPGDRIATTSPASSAADPTSSAALGSTTILQTATTGPTTDATAVDGTATPEPGTSPSPASTDTAPSSPTTPAGPSSTPANTATTGPTTAPASAVTETFTSIGGSATVRLDGGVLTLVSTAPAAGFVLDESSSSATEVEVKFRSASHESKIEVHVVDGQMVAEVEESPEGAESMSTEGHTESDDD